VTVLPPHRSAPRPAQTEGRAPPRAGEAGPDSADADRSGLVERLNQVCAGRSLRALARILGTNHHSVRAYLAGRQPPTSFLQAVCREFDVSADWLLFGAARPPTRAGGVSPPEPGERVNDALQVWARRGYPPDRPGGQSSTPPS
jgi:hypothetical protein